MAIQNNTLLFLDDKCKAVLIDTSSVSTISDFTNEKQIKELPVIPAEKTIPDIGDYFTNKKCDIKLKQEQAILGFNKPGGFYSVLVTSISDETVIIHDMKGRKHIIKMCNVLFIRECAYNMCKYMI